MSSAASMLLLVNSLTEPIKLKRMQEIDHDHDWLSVKIVRTNAEIKALRKVGEKNLDKVIDSGEWWCPWCDRVERMPEHDLPTFEIKQREDPSLLDQLDSSIGNSLEASGGSQLPMERIPADRSALDLALEIRRDVNDWCAKLDDNPPSGLTLNGLVRHWYAKSLARPEAHDRQGRLREWRRRIEAMLHPKPAPEITGICPACEFAFVIAGVRRDDNGKVIEGGYRSRALQGIDGDSYEDCSVTCQVCGNEWSGWMALNELANATRRLAGREERASEPFSA